MAENQSESPYLIYLKKIGQNPKDLAQNIGSLRAKLEKNSPPSPSSGRTPQESAALFRKIEASARIPTKVPERTREESARLFRKIEENQKKYG